MGAGPDRASPFRGVAAPFGYETRGQAGYGGSGILAAEGRVTISGAGGVDNGAGVLIGTVVFLGSGYAASTAGSWTYVWPFGKLTCTVGPES